MYGLLEKIHRSLQTIFVTIKMCEYQRICGCCILRLRIVSAACLPHQGIICNDSCSYFKHKGRKHRHNFEVH